MDKATNKRTVVKSLTWRLIALATTTSIVYLTTGSISGALKIGAIDFVIKLGAYFGHEKAWESVKWGFSPSTQKS